MSALNLSTLDRIQLEIKESIKREKELKNGYPTVKLENGINGESSVNGAKDFSKSIPMESNNITLISRSNTNGFRKFTQNTSGTKGVMHKFIKSRGRLSMSAINTENTQNTWASDAAFKPAKMTIEKGGKPLRNGYISAEEKMRKELKDFQQRELQLREERKKSQPNLMAALQLEEDNEFDDYGCLNGGLKATKSMANLYNNSDDGYEDTSSSTGGSLKPARSLAELCDISDDEGGLPDTCKEGKSCGANCKCGPDCKCAEKSGENCGCASSDQKYKEKK